MEVSPGAAAAPAVSTPDQAVLEQDLLAASEEVTAAARDVKAAQKRFHLAVVQRGAIAAALNAQRVVDSEAA